MKNGVISAFIGMAPLGLPFIKVENMNTNSGAIIKTAKSRVMKLAINKLEKFFLNNFKLSFTHENMAAMLTFCADIAFPLCARLRVLNKIS